jgi:dihydrofolate reductase
MANPSVIYSAAVSLDGYIASDDGGVDWLHAAMVKGEGYGLAEFTRSIDGMMMGSKTYEQSLQMGGGPMMSKTPTWIFSKRPLKPVKGAIITAAPPREVVASLADRGVHRAWLMGGGELAASFLAEGLIDEVSIAVMPVVLGSGIPLFGRLPRVVSLDLIESKTFKGGALGLRYVPKRTRRRG